MSSFLKSSVLLLTWILACQVQAASPVDATSPGTHTVLDELLVAPATNTPGTLPEDLSFSPYNGEIYTDKDLWFKFSVLKPLSRDSNRFLQIENPRLAHTEIWIKQDGRYKPFSLEGLEFGLGYHVSGMPRVSVLLPVDQSPIDVLVRMSDQNTFVPRMHVLDAAELRKDTFINLFLGGIGFGMMLLLAGYNALLAMYTRDKRYRALSAYVGASLFFILHYLGFGQILFWSEWAALDQRIINASALIVFATYIPFALQMLSVSRTLLWRIVIGANWACGIVLLMVDMPGLFAAMTLIGGIACIAMHPIALVVALRGNREAWLFFGATLFSLVGGTTTWTEQLWGFGGGTLGHMLFLWGSVITSISLVILLAKHIVTLRDQRAAAQASADTAWNEAYAKSAFLATMSHEIRTPLNGVLGMAEVLSSSDLSAEQKESVSTIIRSGQSLMGVLNDILDYSKYESGNLDLEKESVDLFTLLDDVSVAAKEQLKDKPVEFRVRVDPKAAEVVITDPSRVRQVLTNIVNNAVKFTDEGFIRIHMTTQGNELRLRVKDSGIGIEPQSLENLFERFRQADSSITRRYGGTGLGLAICKLICEAMQGGINLRSVPGKGSEFEFWFPVDIETQQLGKPAAQTLTLQGASDSQIRDITEIVQRWGVEIIDDAESSYDCSQGLRLCALRQLCCDVPQEASAVNPTPLGGLKILVAEDNPVNQMVARKTLNLFGAQVEIANNGEEAVAKCSSGQYHLILMDCEMPIMDGYSASQNIRQREKQIGLTHTPIIALTAHAGTKYRDRAIASGMDGYVAKPLQRELLLDAILACVPAR